MRESVRDRYRLLVVGVGVVVATALLAPAVAQACAVCLGSSADDPSATGFIWGVLFLAATPFAIVGSIGGWLLYKYRRRPKVVRRSPPQAGGQQPPSSRTSALIQKESWN